MRLMITLAAADLAVLDWAVVAGYLLLLLASGVWFARKEPSGTGEYFLAGRRMPAWAVSFSIIASSLSVATFIGVPESVFRGNMTFLSTTIGSFIAVAVVAGFFIPAFYAANVTTVYALLERRFGSSVKQAASATFMVGRLFASGARIYIAAIPLAMVLFGPESLASPGALVGAIAVLTVVAVLYTLIGGIASVIWTDVLQTLVLVGAAVGAVLVLLHDIPAPIADIWAAMRQPVAGGVPKATVLLSGLDPSQPHLGFDPLQNYTLLTAVFGFSLLNMAAYGTDHDLAQRMLTCKSALRGSRSAWAAILMNLPITMLFMAIGALLWFYYEGPVAGGAAGIGILPPGREAFPHFILTQMPPGLRGLMLAGLFAAGLGSLNSAINAMAATFVSDFYLPCVRGRSEPHYLWVSRGATVAWGLLVGGFAVACIYWKRSQPETTLIDFALKVMTFAYAGLLAVFLTAIFTRRGSTASALAALATGFMVIAAFQSWTVWSPWIGLGSAATSPVAYPWQMLIATSAALAVCAVPRGPQQPPA